jgi:Flp pilus assembly secretin CpaC
MIKKLVFGLVMLFAFSNAGFAALSTEKINVLNLQKSNIYLLDIDSRVKNIEISDKNIVDVYPVTTVKGDAKHLFVEANENGVCDVKIDTKKKSYKVRFVTGSVFEDKHESLTKIDLPKLPMEEK